MKHSKDKSKRTLFFVKFSLTLKGITLDDDSSKDYKLSLPNKFSAVICRKKVDKILFLLDRFGISNDFYHKVTMTDEGNACHEAIW